MVAYLSGVRPGLSPKDEEAKRKLVKCAPRAYSKLIRSDILGPSGSKSCRPPALRPSPPFVMKFAHEGPPVVKPTRGQLRARVETLSRRRRSVKRKSQNSPKKSHPTKGKAPKLGMSSPSPSTEVQVKGQALPSQAEVSRVPSPRLRSSSAAEAKDSSRGVAEPLLEVMPISVWSPPAQSIGLPLTMRKNVGGDCSGAEGDEDSLFSDAELATGAVSSILRDSNLKRSDALPVEEDLALSFQGVISVSSCAFICPSYCGFMLCINSILLYGRQLPI